MESIGEILLALIALLIALKYIVKIPNRIENTKAIVLIINGILNPSKLKSFNKYVHIKHNNTS